MTKARDLANGGFGLVLMKPSTVVGGTDNGKGTVSFSASTGISFNDVFNSTYDNYRIVLNISSSSGSPAIRFRMRVSNADITGSNYAYAHTKNAYTTSNAGDGAGNQTSGVIGYYGVAASSGSFDIHSPFLAQETGIVGQLRTSADIWHVGLKHTLATSYTGFTFYPDSGNITGTVSVYGYNK
jgi:hypothetical protein